MEKNYHFTKETSKQKLKLFTIKIVFIALFMITSAGIVYSQSGCASCTHTNPQPADQNTPLTIKANEVVCFTESKTFGGLNFEGGTLCIAQGATLTITNNVQTSSATTINMEIYGTLLFGQPPQFSNNLKKMEVNIYNGGVMTSGTFENPGNMTFNSDTTEINNHGLIKVNTLDFGNNTTNIINNYNEFSVTGNINILGSSKTTFINRGKIDIKGNYSNSSYSTYINCGTINSHSGFNLGGGRVINTGIFDVPSGAIDMTNGARLENYGLFYSGGTVNGNTNSTFYNEGLAKLTTIQGGTLAGPSQNGKKGYFYLVNQYATNGHSIGPNLDFTKYESYNPDIKSTEQGQDIIIRAQNQGDVKWKGADGNEVESAELAGVTFNAGGTPVTDIGVCPNAEGKSNFWIGEIDTVWSDKRNWTAGVVPFSGENVIFATISNYGENAKNDLVLDQDRTIGNLTNASDKNLIVSPETSLVVNGKVTITDPVKGQPSTDPSKIQVKASNGNANGSLIINCDENSTIDNGKKVPKPIFATVELYAKGEKGHVYSWLDTIPGSPTNNIVTYTGNYRWQHFGVPVKTVKANPTFAGAFLREYSEPLNAEDSYYFKWIILNNESNLTKFKGYEITQDAPTKYYIKGELVFCEQEITLTHTATSVKGSTDDEIYNQRYGLGQNIFGNSFTSSIPISQIIFPEGVENVVYMYNSGTFGEWAANTNDKVQTAGSYIAIPKETASAQDYGNIPSMQGFLLRHLAPNNDNSPITMSLPYMSLTKNTKPQLAPRFNDGKTNDELGFVRVQLTSKSTVDNLWFFSQPGTSENYDNGWDGRKYFGTPTAFIFSETPDGPMQVNTSETIDGNVISFYPNGDKEYTFAIVKSNLDNYRDLHLVDIATKNIVSLHNDTTMYRFTSNVANKINKRFVIVNKAKEQINFDNDDFELLDAYLSSSTNELTVSNFTGKNGIMRIYDVAGSLIMNDEMVTGTNQYQPNLNPGTYILNLSASGKEKSIKILIKKP